MSITLLSPPSSSASRDSINATFSKDGRIQKLMKSYQAEQQLKYLYLEAEIDFLFQQLESIQQQRQETTASKAVSN